MTARGVTSSWAHDDGVRCLSFTAAGANRFDWATTDFTLTGWMRVLGVRPLGGGHNDPGYVMASFFEVSNGWNLAVEGTDTDPTYQTSPWTIRGRYKHTGWTNVSFGTNTDAVATGEDWFYALRWDHTASTLTVSYVKDAGSISHATSAALTLTTAAPFSVIYLFNEGDNLDAGTNAAITNVKVWKYYLPDSDVDAERHSEAPIAAQAYSSSIYADWRLPSSSDLTDSSGNSRTLTATGTIGDGSMDPVDIQGGGGGGGSGGGGRGFQQLESGLYVPSARFGGLLES